MVMKARGGGKRWQKVAEAIAGKSSFSLLTYPIKKGELNIPKLNLSTFSLEMKGVGKEGKI